MKPRVVLCLLIDVLSHGSIYETEKVVKIHCCSERGMDVNLDYYQPDRVCVFL